MDKQVASLLAVIWRFLCRITETRKKPFPHGNGLIIWVRMF